MLTTPILTVGLVIDESYFSDKEQLTKELVACGVKESNIKMIVFRDMKLSLSPHLVIMI
nr:hypothetical protein [Flavobacterium psychrophilum]